MIEEQYIKERLEDQINWYDKKSIFCQKRFKQIRIIELVCASIIPLLAGFSDSIPYSNFIIGFLGMVISISAGIQSIFKYQENWVQYRTTSETLKHQKYLFLTNSPPYNEDSKFYLLVKQTESLISKENSIWTKEITNNKNIKTDKNV